MRHMFSFAAKADATRSNRCGGGGKLIKRLRELQKQNMTRDELLLKLGAARKEAGKLYALLVIYTPTRDQPVTSETFHFALDRNKLRQARRREGGYLLLQYQE